MDKNIFRQKNIDKISSPESLNDYVKVTNPSVWVILIGIVILIIGAMVFGSIGTIDTHVNGAALVTNNQITVYVDEADIANVKTGMKVNIAGKELEIVNIADRPLKASEVDEYVLHRGNMEASMWVYPLSVDTSAEGQIKEGVYTASITVDKTSPMSYIFN